MLNLLLLTACGDRIADQITDLEQTVAESPTKENKKKLVEQYNEYVKVNPSKVDKNVQYLYKAAQLHYEMNEFDQAASLLKQSATNYFSAEGTTNSLVLLADIYMNKLNKKDKNKDYFKIFANLFPDETALQKFLSAQTNALGQNILEKNTATIDTKNATTYIALCEMYAGNFKADETSVDFLLNAANTASLMKNFDKAIGIYDIIYSQFRFAEKAANALFLKGFCLENELGQNDQAKLLYQRFLTNHPKHSFADAAKFSLANLDRTNEEIIQGYIEGNE